MSFYASNGLFGQPKVVFQLCFMEMTLLEKVTRFIQHNRLIVERDKILLAVSGGLDSVALLHIFSQLKSILKLELAVAHVHHGIRGNEADKDLEFVTSLSCNYKLPFQSKKVEAKAFAKSQKYSLEESARILRYKAFEEFLTKSKYSRLATAHTANDQAETVIDHFLRGSGSLGMQGIQVKRGAYIRPLLELTREDLEQYAKENKLTFRQDSSNKDLQFRRNRIRRELIPYLKEHFNPNLVKTLNRTALIFSETESVLESVSDEAYKSLVSLQKINEIIVEIDGFLGYFKAVQKYILFRACQALGINRNDLNFDKLDKVLSVIAEKKIGKRVDINQDFQLAIDHDGIIIKRKASEKIPQIKFDLLDSNALRFGEYELKWSITKKEEPVEFNKNRQIELLDFDKTGNSLCVRTFHPGDRFIPLNFKGQKKIADYFSDRKIPHHLREVTPILESPAGIVWLCGHCIDNRFKVRKETDKLLKVEIKEPSNEF
ncbi:tRNA lysidine(34) synthetase TilS [candidate division KSB1 bacterium]|nr:tRNA lysidine(34) synthetase TilS [candidate division KSB1 bacterium]